MNHLVSKPFSRRLSSISINLNAAIPASSTTSRLVVFNALGNPPNGYANTRHNAGQIAAELLEAQLLQTQQLEKSPLIRSARFSCKLGLSLHYSVFDSAQKKDNENIKTDYMFVKVDGCLMNNSGKVLFPFWRSGIFTKYDKVQHIILHDELEKPLGDCQYRAFKTSARGHNGLRSIDQVSRGDKSISYNKIGVGIDKPEHGSISDYVLENFPSQELRQIETKTTPKIIELLKKHKYL